MLTFECLFRVFGIIVKGFEINLKQGGGKIVYFCLVAEYDDLDNNYILTD